MIFYSDRGNQYAAKAVMDILKKNGINQLFPSPGNPMENAAAESIFATFKKEEAHQHNYTSEQSILDDVENYIEFFNNEQQHQTPNYHTPAKFERKLWLCFFDIVVSFLVAFCKNFSLFLKSSFLYFRYKSRKPIALQRVFVNIKPCFQQNCQKQGFSYVISVHFRYRFLLLVLARFVALFFSTKRIIIMSNPSSRIRAIIHWTIAFSSSNLSVLFLQKENAHQMVCVFFLEVPARFELANESFADSCLTTWPRYHMK